jgi:hypothetical protein
VGEGGKENVKEILLVYSIKRKAGTNGTHQRSK